jgi:hypothetical protein
MKTFTMAILWTAAAFATAAGAAPAELEQRELPLTSTLEPVDRIPAMTRLHSWSVVGEDTLILWATPHRPYLVRLFRPSPELRFAHSIGVTSFGSQIHAKFDAVEVDGFRYPIREIYKMSRSEAKAAQARS